MSVDNIKEKVLLRGGSAKEWTNINTLLLAKEIGIETDTYKMKLGDGVRKWRDLPYLPYSQITKAFIDKWNQAAIDASLYRNSVVYNITQNDIDNWNAGGVETDPIFSASPAFSISQTDIDNWNDSIIYAVAL